MVPVFVAVTATWDKAIYPFELLVLRHQALFFVSSTCFFSGYAMEIFFGIVYQMNYDEWK